MTTALKNCVMTLVAFAAVLAWESNEARAQGQDNQIYYQATLRSSDVEPLANGFAEYSVLRSGRIRFSCEVRDLVMTTAIDVFADDVFLGSADVDESGTATLRFSSFRRGDRTPLLRENTLLVVLDQDGVRIATGVLKSGGGENR